MSQQNGNAAFAAVNVCRCHCNCPNDTSADEIKLCSTCVTGDATYHYVPDTIAVRREFSDALRAGNARFGVPCRHERVFFGCCSFCGVRVRTAIGGAA